jgi:hypothetical protein
MPTLRKPHRPSGSRASRTRQRAGLTAGAAAPSSSANTRLGARTEFRIYPSIGIARVGDSKDGFLIGPEAPGVVPTGPFRGSDGDLKPQAARFRIYKVEIDGNENETVVEEVVASANTKIEWSVSLANRKAAGLQILDTLQRVPNPLPRNPGLDRRKLVITASGSVTGSGQSGPVLSGSIEFAKARAKSTRVSDIVLTTLRTDDAGRLLVVGGPGTSASPSKAKIESFADNDGWYDSVSDGPVSATLRIGDRNLPVIPAWVLITVPRFAPGIYGVVTWYDQAVNMARSRPDGRFDRPRSTSFTRDIYPILKRADGLSNVQGVAHVNDTIRPLSDAARIAGFAVAANRAAVQSRLTPVGTSAGNFEILSSGMPRLNSGANPDPGGPIFTYPSLTKYQMMHVDNWVQGNFDDDWPGTEPAPPPFEKIPVARQAWALCEAALEACIGEPFFPGIEGTYDIARITTYHPEPNLRREFRVDPAHPAGFLTEKMALPWQADFADCVNDWWPSQRPDDVTTKKGANEVRWDRKVVGTNLNGHLNMVKDWAKLGFVVRDESTGEFVEDERTL